MLEILIARWGYLAIALGAFFEGEAVLLIGGAVAHRGLLSLPLVLLAAFAGSVAGDQLWFQLGRRWGRPFLERRPSWKARAAKVQTQFEKHGDWFVFGFRFIYGIRTVTPALLGTSQYSAARFACLNLLGGALWAAAVGGAGWGLGAAVASALQRAARIEELLGAGCAVLLAAWCLWKLVRARRGN